MLRTKDIAVTTQEDNPVLINLVLDVTVDNDTTENYGDGSIAKSTGTLNMTPNLTIPAASKPTQTHKWWGSLTFFGELNVDDSVNTSYIAPDPISARVTNKGVRIMGIPSGLDVAEDGSQFNYTIPEYSKEVHDGIAIANSVHNDLKAYVKNHSAGSVTVIWKSDDADVMEATFVQGSPYAYFKVYDGDFMIRTLEGDGDGKGIFYDSDNTLGVWTNVSNNRNNFLIVGENTTFYSNISTNNITATNATKEFTLVYLPEIETTNPDSNMISAFISKARNVVDVVNIDYEINDDTNKVTVTHKYLNSNGEQVNTLTGMQPLHWKNSLSETTDYNVRSARGVIKFVEANEFSYTIPFVGVLPSLPSFDNSFDQATLEQLVRDFVNLPTEQWNSSTDTYSAGKNYAKVAELAAIADSIGMDVEKDQLIDWLKLELEDWFTAPTNEAPKTNKYFVYDENWNTLIGINDSNGSHEHITDHHIHYGYFVRAAAEICRADPSWHVKYGEMIKLLIRDYAADSDDSMFPQMRNFDQANGFSWGDGRSFIRDENNESSSSTTETATAYGAIVLYGLATGDEQLTKKGMYLHASTSAAYWEYWNNIDKYNNVSDDANNFPEGFVHIAASRIWGDGAELALNELGNQGISTNTLSLHVGLHTDYMNDFVGLGLTQSTNGKPSGLSNLSNLRGVWWKLLAMTDADAALADYNSMSDYQLEDGETKAHTYYWIHTLNALGNIKIGTGELTANYPGAMAFLKKNGVTTYIVYNYTNESKAVTFSDGIEMNAAPSEFTIINNIEN